MREEQQRLERQRAAATRKVERQRRAVEESERRAAAQAVVGTGRGSRSGAGKNSQLGWDPSVVAEAPQVQTGQRRKQQAPPARQAPPAQQAPRKRRKR